MDDRNNTIAELKKKFAGKKYDIMTQWANVAPGVKGHVLVSLYMNTFTIDRLLADIGAERVRQWLDYNTQVNNEETF